jgi:hypothetical protein
LIHTHKAAEGSVSYSHYLSSWTSAEGTCGSSLLKSGLKNYQHPLLSTLKAFQDWTRLKNKTDFSGLGVLQIDKITKKAEKDINTE